jgi:hypothetical protein
MIYITYEDEGPKGICCQSCSITSPWKKLFKINADDVSKVMLDDYIERMNKHRTNARISIEQMQE